ncbi:hypothetical protein E1B28_011972 [Marasmius oreades]|nr:uncharacterized protein E1B28_011972 [Marasmius oreades]KAG7087925.1 hypothetical protein E1B28_011972 [Marasmius oreades]
MPGDVESHMPPGSSSSMSAGGSAGNNRRNQPKRPAQVIDHVPPLPPAPTPTYHYPSSYGQRPAFYGSGQYTMPAIAPAHVHHYPYPPGQGFRVPADPGMLSPNVHANYPSMMTAPYPYQHQRHSPECNSPSQAGFSNPNIYGPPQHQHANPSPPPPFTNHGQFHSLRYPSPIPHSPPYTGYQTPAPYSYQSQSQYSYPRPDSDGQGTWWYLPVAHLPHYESTPPPSASYQAPPFTMGYSPVNHPPQHHETEPSPPHRYPSSVTVSSPPSLPQNHILRPPIPSGSFHPPQPQPQPQPQPPPPVSLSPAPPPPDPPSPPKVVVPPESRKSYHPSPPAHRSEWVMWTGNVPPDATHDELWRFFTQKPQSPPVQPQSPSPLSLSPHSHPHPVSGSSSSSSSYQHPNPNPKPGSKLNLIPNPIPNSHLNLNLSPVRNSNNGVVSIFLISRSSCAFVNYESLSTLEIAIQRFNGLPLRSHDPRCPRLVCRVRKKDDDLRAGVGGQRGVGMHIRYIRAKEARERQQKREEGLVANSTSTSTLTTSTNAVSSASMSEEDSESVVARAGSVDGAGGVGRGIGKRFISSGGGQSNNSSGSYASTTSSLFTRYFPKRFFILKSLSQYDLDLSVEKGLWATQKHNEGILDQAYRTSSEVYLIFGVNRSGEFYGYARMTGPVKGEHAVSWGPRTDSASSVASTRSSLSPVTGRASVQADTIFEEGPSGSPRAVFERSFGDIHTGAGSSSASAKQFFTDHLVDESPAPLTGSSYSAAAAVTPPVSSYAERRSAPAELKDHHKKITLQTPVMKFSLDYPKMKGMGTSRSMGEGMGKAITTIPPVLQRDFQLDEEAPVRAMKRPSGSGSGSGSGSSRSSSEGREPSGQVDGVVGKGGQMHSPGELGPSGQVDGVVGKGKQLSPSLSPSSFPPGVSPPPSGSSPPAPVPPPAASPRAGKEKDREESWGDSFKVEWIQTERLPFYRTRHIRNPWNHDREIKVSRDGTELEPGVGQQLLDEWERYVKEKEEKEKGVDGVVGGEEDVEGKPKYTPSVVGVSSSTRKSAVGKRNG